MNRGFSYWMSLVVLMGAFALGSQAWAVPSFSRQTGFACDACHTSYPGLTALGREFKLNGYQMGSIKKVTAQATQSSPGMGINQIPNLSVILQVGEEGMSKAAPDTQNPSANFPKELGLYYAGRIAPHLGTFLQVTYDSGGDFGMDMSDIRYARHAQLFGEDAVWGLDLNNGPTFEDVWNSTPGYGWPYVENDAPIGADGPFIASDTVQTNVIGYGAYQYWDNLIYAYVGVYQSAAQGNTPASSGGGAIAGAAPYYRVAVTPLPNLEIGSFGFFSQFRPDQWSHSDSERYNDLGFDAQYQWYPNNRNIMTFHATYIHEVHNGLARTAPEGYTGQNSLTTDFLTLDANWYYRHRYGVGLGYFSSRGDKSTYYALTSPGDYQADTRPNTDGEIVQLDYLPWQNTRFSVQYIAYNKFHGASSNYDSNGRSASDNNTWLLNALFGF